MVPENWKSIVVVIVAIIAIVASIIYLKTSETYIEPVGLDQNIKDFLENQSRKLNNVILTREQFESFDSDWIFYYFPDPCPNYKEDYLLLEETDAGERYYVPEQFALIKFPKKVVWTKEPNFEFWKLENKL